MTRCSAMCSDLPKEAYSKRNLEQDLRQLVKGSNIERYRDVLERPLASSAVAGRLPRSLLLLPRRPPMAVDSRTVRKSFWL